MSWEAQAWVWDLEIKGNLKWVLMGLANYADQENKCWPSIVTLSRKLGMKKRQVITNVADLVGLELIRKERGRHYGNNVYRLAVGQSPSGAKTALEQVQKLHLLQVQKLHPNLISESLSVNPKNPDRPAAEPPVDPPSEKKEAEIIQPPKPRKTLAAEIKEPADRIYQGDPVKFARLVVWITAAERTYTAAVIAAALNRFVPLARGVQDWWPYLDKILDAEEGRANGRTAERQSERWKREEREWLRG